MNTKELEKRCNELFFQVNEKTERIADLEKENAELKKKCYKKAVKDYCELEKENAELKLKLEALEGQTPWKDIKDKSELIKENAELKAQIEKMKCCGNCTKGNCVNIGQKGKACAYWISNELRR